MDEPAVTPQKKKITRKKAVIQKDSLQYNAQDMNQEQKLDMNPIQSNTQHLHIYIDNKGQDYSGRITGTTCLEANRSTIRHAEVQLFLGGESRCPVMKAHSDENGNFTLERLPPGFYTLYVKSGDALRYQSGYIKLLPCETVYQTVLLKD